MHRLRAADGDHHPADAHRERILRQSRRTFREALGDGSFGELLVGRNDPGFLHNGPLAGLVAVCAGSDLMHPVGALATGAIAGALFVWAFTATQTRWKIDDVLGDLVTTDPRLTTSH